MSDQAMISAGHQAEREYAQTEDAFERVRLALIDELIRTSPINVDQVRTLHLAIQNLQAVRKAVLAVITGGQLAKRSLEIAGLI